MGLGRMEVERRRGTWLDEARSASALRAGRALSLPIGSRSTPRHTASGCLRTWDKVASLIESNDSSSSAAVGMKEERWRDGGALDHPRLPRRMEELGHAYARAQGRRSHDGFGCRGADGDCVMLWRRRGSGMADEDALLPSTTSGQRELSSLPPGPLDGW